MFELIDCRFIRMEKFNTEHGYQPKNSLFYITDGEFEYKTDTCTSVVTVGDLFICPDNIYFDRKITKPISFYYVRFENKKHIHLDAQVIHINDTARLVATLRYLTELSKIPTDNSNIKNHFLSDIFYQAETEKKITESYFDPLVSETVYYIQKHAETDMTLEYLATRAGVSVPSLILRFKKAIGTTPIDFLIHTRIKKGEMLLCASSLSVSQIAKQCGFENAYYFSNTFKKHTGLSPVNYRKKTSL